MAVHLYLVRHGQTYFNVYNRMQGWSNSPLTDKGIAEARQAGDKLANVWFTHAFSSDTTRASTTAEVILSYNHASSGIGVETHMEFREQFYGYFEGKDMSETWWAAGAGRGVHTYNEIYEQFGSAATRDFLKEADPFHHAESDQEYWTRVITGFNIIATHDKIQDEDNVLIVAHGNTLLSLMQRFAADRYDLSVRPRNGSVTRLDFDCEVFMRDGFDAAISVQGYNE